MSKNDLTLAYRVRNPGRRKRSTILKTMLKAVDSREFPAGFPDVEILWRNTPSQDQRSDEFIKAMNESRSGFHTQVRRRLQKDIAIHEMAERETAAIRKEAAAIKAATREIIEAQRRRSAAARKGWETRKRNATKAAAKSRRTVSRSGTRRRTVKKVGKASRRKRQRR